MTRPRLDSGVRIPGITLGLCIQHGDRLLTQKARARFQ